MADLQIWCAYCLPVTGTLMQHKYLKYVNPDTEHDSIFKVDSVH